MKKLLSVLFLLSFTLASVYAQNIQVKGTVVSGSDNEPLPGVNVVVKGTTNGGITDWTVILHCRFLPTQHFLLPILVLSRKK